MLAPGGDSAEDLAGITWTIERDVLAGTTSCVVDHGSTYEIPYDGTATEHYEGRVTVDQATFEQDTTATTTMTIRWPDVEVATVATMDVQISAEAIDVTIDLTAREATAEGYTTVGTRRWRQSYRRRARCHVTGRGAEANRRGRRVRLPGQQTVLRGCPGGRSRAARSMSPASGRARASSFPRYPPESSAPRSFGEHQLLHDVRRQPERLALGCDGDVARPRAADRDVEELALLQAVLERLPALQLSLVAMIRMGFVDGVVCRTGIAVVAQVVEVTS